MYIRVKYTRIIFKKAFNILYKEVIEKLINI